jgi:uncharacterized membrane protein (DUF485 family)
MKTNIILLITLSFLQIASFPQVDTVYYSDSTGYINISRFSSPLDSALCTEIVYRYERARKMNIAGIAMGSAANLTLIVNSNPLVRNYWEEYNVIIAVFGEVSAVIRLGFSGSTIHQLNLVQQELDKLRLIKGYETKYDQSYKSLKTAQNLSVAVPILGAAGLGLMLTYVYVDLMNDKTSTAWLAAGWTCAAAGLITSVVSQIYIVKAMKVFQTEAGSLNMAINNSGIGFYYRF